MHPKNKTIIYTLLCFVIGIGIWIFADKWQQNELVSRKKLDLIHDLQIHSNALNLAANKRFALLESLNAFILSNIKNDIKLDSQIFTSFVSNFFNNSQGIRNMIIAPDGINKFVYPLEGNEAAVGHNLLNDERPNVQADIEEALRTGSITLSGPYELRQGGIGVIARLAIFNNNKFWGFVTMALDIPPILSESELGSSEDDHNFAVFNNNNFVFYGDQSILNDNPVIISVILPDGEWHLAGTPLEGWNKYIIKKRLFPRIYELLFVLLIIFIVYLILNKQVSLYKQVEKRTLDLVETNQTLQNEIILRKKAEEVISAQLQEKKIILRETHHRIKNNFTSIAGLLTLHANSITNSEAISALNDATGRINSMTILHEKLLQQDSSQTTSTKDYLDSLIDEIISFFPVGLDLKVEKNMSDFQVDPKILIPIGIIVNELITNIMKYAFTDRDTGLIEVTLTKDQGNIILIIQDDGNGLPEEFDIENQKGFGIKLIKLLSLQLEGSFSIENYIGTRSIIKFNV